MESPYIDVLSGGYYVAGTRVSLDSIVYAFREGESPEAIQRNFEALSLEHVYGAIAYYLHHRDEVDRNILEGEEAAHRLAPPLSQRNPEAWERLQKARLQAPGRS
jgi:uncharacterized protein (DUF433 family)